MPVGGGGWRYSSTLSLTSTPGGICGQRHALAALPQGTRPGTHCIEGWVDPRAGQVRKNLAPTGIFLFVLSLFSSLSFLSIVCFYIFLSSCHLFLYNTTQISMPPVGFEPATSASERPLGSARDSRTVQPVASHCTVCAVPANFFVRSS
jgi:hypothetical protein